jgi:hypothetical protein
VLHDFPPGETSVSSEWFNFFGALYCEHVNTGASGEGNVFAAFVLKMFSVARLRQAFHRMRLKIHHLLDIN